MGISKLLKTYIFRGFLAVIPLVLSLLTLQILYVFIDRRIMDLVEESLGFSFPGLGILLLLVFLFLLGLIVSNVIGRHLMNLLDRVSNSIPLVKTVYKIGKQLAATLSLSDNRAFSRAVLVEYLKPGMWTLGFVTGTLIDHKNGDEKLLKIYIPTPPNPTSGTMVVVREAQVRDPGWSVEEAMQVILSGGIIGPSSIT